MLRFLRRWVMVRWWASSRGRPASPRDPDREVSRRAVRDIAVESALLSAGMVIAGAMLLLVGLWVNARRQNHREPHTGGLLVRLDPDDLTVFLVIVMIGVVVLAGLGTLLLARRAIRPLEESMRRQRTFVADASHELRTPLAVASARSQQLALMVRGDAGLEAVAGELHSDITIMADVVNDMLAAMMEERNLPAESDLSEVLEQVVADMDLIARKRGNRIDVSGVEHGGQVVGLSRSEVRRALTAVIDNAIGYSPSGGAVVVGVTGTERRREVRVTDHGPGITGIEPDRVFERFAHGAQPTSGGTTRSAHGIGLSLVHDLLARRGGSICVETTGPEGTTFLMRFPVTEP